MREPRYRFPEIVRDATRTMAARMVAEGTFVQTPEELDGWIAQAPEIGGALRKGGYGTAFEAHDLLPLLHVMVTKAGGPTAGVETVPPPSRRGWLLGAALVAAVVIVVFLIALATGTFSGAAAG